MEGQPFLMVLAGLGVSLAGFSSLLTLFRADNNWDPVSLWRAKTIVRASLNVASAALVPVPVFYLTGSEQWAIRAGTAMLLALSVIATIRSSPQKQPAAWPEGYSVVPFYVIRRNHLFVNGAEPVAGQLGIAAYLASVGSGPTGQHLR